MPIYVVPGRTHGKYHTEENCPRLSHVENVVEHEEGHVLETWHEECGACQGREDRPEPGTEEAKEHYGRSPEDVLEEVGLEVSDS